MSLDKNDDAAPEIKAESPSNKTAAGGNDRFAGAVVGAALITVALVGSAKAKLLSGKVF